jgi:hypothetical protein
MGRAAETAASRRVVRMGVALEYREAEAAGRPQLWWEDKKKGGDLDDLLPALREASATQALISGHVWAAK